MDAHATLGITVDPSPSEERERLKAAIQRIGWQVPFPGLAAAMAAPTLYGRWLAQAEEQHKRRQHLRLECQVLAAQIGVDLDELLKHELVDGSLERARGFLTFILPWRGEA